MLIRKGRARAEAISAQFRQSSAEKPVEEMSQKPKWFTPLNNNMEHNHGGLEDHFPF